MAMVPKNIVAQWSRKIGKMHHLRLMYRMSQLVRGANKNFSAGSARSIVLYPHSQNGGVAPDYDG